MPNERTIQVAGNLGRFGGVTGEKSPPQTKEPEDVRSNVFYPFPFLLVELGRGRVGFLIVAWGDMDITTWFLRLWSHGGQGLRSELLTRFGNDLLESFPQRS